MFNSLQSDEYININRQRKSNEGSSFYNIMPVQDEIVYDSLPMRKVYIYILWMAYKYY